MLVCLPTDRKAGVGEAENRDYTKGPTLTTFLSDNVQDTRTAMSPLFNKICLACTLVMLRFIESGAAANIQYWDAK